MVSSYRLGMVTFLPVRTDSSGRAKEKGLAPAAMSGKINITPKFYFLFISGCRVPPIVRMNFNIQIIGNNVVIF
jgi:hypothetical protein